MQKFITLQPINKVNGTLTLPGSKSLSNRVLLLSAQSSGTTRIYNLLDSDDVRYMLEALKKLGIIYRFYNNGKICEIDGIGRSLYCNSKLTLFLGNAGTALRPLTAALSLYAKDIILTGEKRMTERPIGDLIDALKQGGAKIDYLSKINYPPIRIRGGYVGGHITINGELSSQFITALLMMAPLAPEDSTIHIVGNLVSKPYITITIALMKNFGIEVQHDDTYQNFYIKGATQYRSPGEYFIEGDASSASYFLAAAAIRGGTVRVKGITKNSIQGDIYFANVLEKMGAIIKWGENFIECTRGSLQSIDMDMNAIPDSAMTIAIVALFATGESTTLRNIYNWRIKETDRLRAMSIELRKIGASVTEGKDFITVKPPTIFIPATIHTYNDHRIAMCFSLLALANIPITIENPACTNKTFPNFFKQLANISFFK
ncbi:3-phosphoshikimate 1-carboxyvinyltransferase [Candidatus Schneideria nysicola]|uniref:3-phosphoshikimate 1-carboxyvinyltransferase n=1 Tax=Candidatus Schneideria nysicola TaxID=1081631 RepID=UPI001CAA649D|nr:3-phosphoshikimate 1-carboxyvinyltransferase [Candidatus Schneideria nysicola]UAJ65819.1 3-phosphoshikimate 1-carboxyvinyltransferase [Candidatus Schneideria nysicola]